MTTKDYVEEALKVFSKIKASKPDLDMTLKENWACQIEAALPDKNEEILALLSNSPELLDDPINPNMAELLTNPKDAIKEALLVHMDKAIEEHIAQSIDKDLAHKEIG